MAEKLRREFIDLLEKDKEFRYTVAGYIGLSEILEKLDRHEAHILEMLKRLDRHESTIAEILKRLDRHEEELVKLREDMNRGFELVERRISALGATWGMMTEESFREAIRGL